MKSERAWPQIVARFIATKRLPAALVCTGLLVGATAGLPAAAQVPPAQDLTRPVAADDGAASRAELLSLIDSTAALAEAFHLDAATVQRLVDARASVASAQAADLDGFRQIAPQVRQLREVLAQAEAVLRSQPALAGPESLGFPQAEDPNYNWNFFIPSQSASLDDAGGAGDASTDSESENGNCSFANRKTTQELFALLNGTAIAEVVQQVASRICDQVIVVIGGGNASLFCIITDVIYDVVKAIQDNIFLCEDILDGAENSASYLRLGHLHTDLENAEANLSTDIEAARVDINETVIQAAADQITAVNNAATTIVNVVNVSTQNVLSAVQANQDLFLRIEIEKALHSGKHFATLYLPEAHGGQLGLVRQIVADAIAAVQSSGDPINGALQRFNTAEQEFAAQRWKKAFTWYSDAYFEAVRVLGETR